MRPRSLFLQPPQMGRGPIAHAATPYYSTNFALNESPMVEDGGWLLGARDATLWSDIVTNGGLAYGTQANGGASPPYNDSLAFRRSGFGANYIVEATVHLEPANVVAGGYHELELYARTGITAGSAHGYEFNHAWDGAYTEIVRLNGGNPNPGDFTGPIEGTPHAALTTGCRMKLVCSGNVLTGYVDYNDGGGYRQVIQVDITVTFSSGTNFFSGQPGFGHWNHGTTNTVTALAFSSWSAIGI